MPTKSVLITMIAVNYGVPRWQTLEGNYVDVNANLNPAHYPIMRKGEIEWSLSVIT